MVSSIVGNGFFQDLGDKTLKATQVYSRARNRGLDKSQVHSRGLNCGLDKAATAKEGGVSKSVSGGMRAGGGCCWV